MLCPRLQMKLETDWEEFSYWLINLVIPSGSDRWQIHQNLFGGFLKTTVQWGISKFANEIGPHEFPVQRQNMHRECLKLADTCQDIILACGRWKTALPMAGKQDGAAATGTFICLLAYFFLYSCFRSLISTNVDRHLFKVYFVRLWLLKSATFFK